MSFIDYGSVVKKNGKIIQKNFFMNMKESVGFTINKIKRSYKSSCNCYDYESDRYIKTPTHEDYYIKINNNQFSYFGDKDFLVCVYKNIVRIIDNGRIIFEFSDLDDWFGYTTNLHKFHKIYTIKGVKLDIKRLFNNNRYRLRFWYKGDLYECLFGYGVDVNKNLWYYSCSSEKEYVKNWFKESK